MNLNKLAEQLSTLASALRRMTADEVKEFTGYSIGDTPSFPNEDGTNVFAEGSFLRFRRVWRRLEVLTQSSCSSLLT